MKGCKRIRYVQSVWFTAVHTFLVFFLKDTNKALIRKAVLLTSCKHRQMFQFNCAVSPLSDTKPTASCQLTTLIQNAVIIHHSSTFTAKQTQFTYSKTYLLTYSTQQYFFRTERVFSSSGNSAHFMEPEGSLPHLEEPATRP